MDVTSSPRPVEPEPSGANIIRFKPRAVTQRPVRAVAIESGSAWYHEAAIKEAEARTGRKP